MRRSHHTSVSLEITRLQSIPVTGVADIMDQLVAAVTCDVNNPKLEHHELGRPLIDTARLRKEGKTNKKDVNAAVAALPLAAMTGFYDDSILSMRWISEAGPRSLTASVTCWWVRVGQSRSASGKMFPWGESRELALADAKAWRDMAEKLGDRRTTGVSD